ncbi:receptor-like kinase [Striga asiatica]|uniref:Receptor-like kinase n=1 Tax=Striga asiatica TaxID=4170 RepID=A0A5A7Q0L8_STRAF|nr:receptor-like kinase [Striga asiatica]
MMNTIGMIFMATLWILIMRSQSSDCPQPQGITLEGSVLLTFKCRLNDTLNILTTWGKTQDPCDGTWNGITCDSENVTEILLEDNLLGGELGPELSNLTELQTLNLGNNNLTGQIPKELGLLTNLRDMDLENNRFTGSIPPELGNCTSLIYLTCLRNNEELCLNPPNNICCPK